MSDPAKPAPDATQPQDPGSDIVAQLLEVLRHTERSILLLEALPRLDRAHVDREGRGPAVAAVDQLRGLRDRLEEAFELEQAARLRAGSIGFEADVAQLRAVMKDLEAATRRAARAQEILSYVAMAVDLVSNVVAKLAPFL